jgi:hypothetical protein
VIRKLAAAVVMAAALAASASAAGGPLGPISSLPAGWSHAQINVVIRHQPHTLTYDRGRVTLVTPSSLVLRERDGSMVTITVGPSTQIRINGSPATIAQVRRGGTATTLSVDGAAASFVRIVRLGGLAG